MPSTAIAVRPSWLTRTLAVLRLIRVEQPTEFVAGSDFVGEPEAISAYQSLKAMSALAAFPWVRAAVNAIATDLSGLPRRAYRGGTDEAIDRGHPALDLLRMPSSKIAGVEWDRQWITDFELCGNAYAIAVRSRRGGPPASLLRLHPERTNPVAGADGQSVGLLYRGAQETIYSYEDTLHAGYESWSDDPTSLLGVGAIQVLDEELTADLAARRLAKRSADKGRPSGLLSPDPAGDLGGRLAPNQVADLRSYVDKMLRDHNGGVGILGVPMKFQELAFTLRDMEFQGLRASARDAVLAAFGVPGTRVGIPNANYATAENDHLIYWGHLMGKAALLDGELSRLCAMFGTPDLEVRRDFSAVPILQVYRRQQLERVQMHIANGIQAVDAYEAEGMTRMARALREQAEAAAEAASAQAARENESETQAEEMATEARAALSALQDAIDSLPDGVDPSLLLDVQGSLQAILDSVAPAATPSAGEGAA